MANYKIPPVDPEWDYKPQWELVHHMKYLIEESITQMALWENATKETNQTLHELIEEVNDDGSECINLTDFHSSNLTDN